MAVSGTSCSTCSSSYLSVKDTNQLRQDKSSQNLDLNDKGPSTSKEPAEFIFRGELLEEANQNNGFREKRAQTIDPTNQSAINNYEDNSKPTNQPIALEQQGSILDAYA